MAEALEWYRAGHIKTNPFKIFDVSEAASAYRYFSSAQRIGKVVVSLENRLSRLRVCAINCGKFPCFLIY